MDDYVLSGNSAKVQICEARAGSALEMTRILPSASPALLGYHARPDVLRTGPWEYAGVTMCIATSATVCGVEAARARTEPRLVVSDEEMSLEFEPAGLDAMDSAADAATRRAHAALDDDADAWRFADP